MAVMPPLYRCKVCDLPLRPGDNTVVRLAVVWLKAKGTTISSVAKEQHEYKHEYCNDKKLDAVIQDTLF